MCDRDTQAVSAEKTGEDGRGTTGCCHRAARGGYVIRRAEFTRMIRHWLIILRPPLSPSHLGKWKSLPSICISVLIFAPPPLHVCVYAMDSKLRANEWKSGILKALGELYAIFSFCNAVN